MLCCAVLRGGALRCALPYCAMLYRAMLCCAALYCSWLTKKSNCPMQVEPLLEVLVGKCLEQGLMEVMEEEELAGMRAHQQHYEQVRISMLFLCTV